MESILEEIAALKTKQTRTNKLILLVIRTEVIREGKPLYMYACKGRKKVSTNADPLSCLSMDQKIEFYKKCKVVVTDDKTGAATAFVKRKLNNE